MLAAADDIGPAMMADEDLLRFAVAEQRALVTEDVGDFNRIVRTWAATGERHAGIVFTSPRRFHRGRTSYPEDLVVALRRFLADPPAEDRDWVHWLD